MKNKMHLFEYPTQCVGNWEKATHRVANLEKLYAVRRELEKATRCVANWENSTHCVENWEKPHTVWPIGMGFQKHNPKGVAYHSPGLRVPALPWGRTSPAFQPQRGCTSSVMFNPVGVDKPFSRQPSVARIRATLGFDVQPPWGCFNLLKEPTNDHN